MLNFERKKHFTCGVGVSVKPDKTWPQLHVKL